MPPHLPIPAAPRSQAPPPPETPPGMTPQEAAAYLKSVLLHQEGDDGPLHRMSWRYHPAFPVDRIPGTKSDWTKWYASEKRERARRHPGDGYFASMEDWLRNSPDDPPFDGDPIVLSTDPDTPFPVLAGNHRVAIAKKFGVRTLPLFLGTASG